MLNLICIYNIAPYNVVDCLLEHFDSCKLGTLGIWFFLTSRKFRLCQECAPYLLLFSFYLPHAVVPTGHRLPLEFSLKLALCLPRCRSKQGKLNKLGFQSPMNSLFISLTPTKCQSIPNMVGTSKSTSKEILNTPNSQLKELASCRQVEMLSFHLKLDCTFGQWRRTCKSHNIAKGWGISSWQQDFCRIAVDLWGSLKSPSQCSP